MIKRPTLARLIESAIGRLAIHQIDAGERNVVRDGNGEIKSRLATLQALINSAPFERRASPAVIDALKKILGHVEIGCAPDFIVFVARRYPKMMTDLSMDPRIRARINHLFRVAEIGACFSKESLSRLNGGVSEVRRKVFEISQQTEQD